MKLSARIGLEGVKRSRATPVCALPWRHFHIAQRLRAKAYTAFLEWNPVCFTQVREEKVMKLRKNMERGFTLIELAVGAALVSVIGVLLPAVQRIL